MIEIRLFRLVRTGLAEAGIDFGVFGPLKKADASATPKRSTSFVVPNGESNGHANGDASGNGAAIPEVSEEQEEDGGEEGDEEEGERQSRPIIKLRPARHGRQLSRSRSRRDLSQAAEDGRSPVSPDANDRESVANVRFSAHIVAKTDLSALLPFALIAPEVNKHPRRTVAPDIAAQLLAASQQPSDDVSAPPEGTPQTPASIHSTKNYAFLHQGPPEDLKGIFVRKFRWGTIDVLDPNHCDFAALRTAVLSTHLKVRVLLRRLNY